MNVGIIGQGFVGTAVREGLRKHHTILTYDKKHLDHIDYFAGDLGRSQPSSSPVSQLCVDCAVIFICLPTPMGMDGSCDTSIVESTIALIYDARRNRQSESVGLCYSPTIIIKSTVPPGTTKELMGKYPGTKICFNPEFLTERDPVGDFQRQNRIVIGVEDRGTATAVSLMYREAFPGVEQCVVDSTTAELVKYFTNVALAVRVSLANEFYQIAQKLDLDYGQVQKIANLDPRLGGSHWQVPGLDGKMGFSGSCFPKDLNGLITFAESIGVSCPTMLGAWQTNLNVRPERDWEQLVGRAVIG
jgi:UDPglucose 6-dehydrogenase